MKPYLFIFFLILANHGVFAQDKYSVRTANISFEVKNAGIVVKGSIFGLQATIKFDPEKLAGSRMKGSVKVNTLRTGIEARDKHLMKAAYFDVANYPEISIVSDFFGRTESGFRAYCKLTMKGITKDIVIPFTFLQTGEGTYLNGSFTINRLDYQIGESSLILSDDITVYINLNLEHNA